MFEEWDVCYECTGYGDDYFVNENGELECWCPHCPVYKEIYCDDEEWDE